MRLVCPNCEAKYEVPDDAIPDSGRDVQCASCGHAWYQMRPRSGSTEAAAAPVAPAVAPEAEPAVAEAAVSAQADSVADDVDDSPVVAEVEPEVDAAIDPDAGSNAEPEAEVAAAEASEAVEAAAEDQLADADTEAEIPGLDEAVADVDATVEEAVQVEQEPEAEPELEPEAELVAEGKAAYAVDDSVLAILREEAERESSARRAEARPLEVQSDLGIESAIAAPAAAAVAVEDKPSARRDLLPDVEEINSTLRPSEAEVALDDGVDGPIAAQRGGGFRSGFLWVMTIAMLGAGLYLAAPALSRNVPALAGPLESYVGMINGLRLELDGLMRSATLALDGG